MACILPFLSLAVTWCNVTSFNFFNSTSVLKVRKLGKFRDVEVLLTVWKLIMQTFTEFEIAGHWSSFGPSFRNENIWQCWEQCLPGILQVWRQLVYEVDCGSHVHLDTYCNQWNRLLGCPLVCNDLSQYVPLYFTCQNHIILHRTNIEEQRHSNFTNVTDSWLPRTYTCVYVYSGLVAAMILITFARSFLFFIFSIRASSRLHNKMFDSVSSATMRFFNTNPSGNYHFKGTFKLRRLLFRNLNFFQIYNVLNI